MDMSGGMDELFDDEAAALRHDLDEATVERLRAASRSASRSISVGGTLRNLMTPMSTAARSDSIAFLLIIKHFSSASPTCNVT